MSDETPESLIPYDEIVQEALRDVVGRVLGQVERTGALPGDHHFYITFKTRMPGVSIPKHLTERFPDEMTIVLQHRFWDLKVEKDCVQRRPVVRRRAVDAPRALRGGHRLRRSGGRLQPEVPGERRRRRRTKSMRKPRMTRLSRSRGERDGSNVVNVDFTRKK